LDPPDQTTAPIIDPDAALVARARDGDPDAARDLYRLHERRVYNIALRMTGNPWDAADATQETFIKALTGLDRFRGTARFSTWIHRIAVNVVYDSLRRRRADPLDEETMERLANTPSGSGVGSLQGVDPAMDGLSSELRQALMSLDEGFRLTVVLCDLLGFSYAEAAEALEIQEGTVKSRLFRARAQLAERLNEGRGPQRNQAGTAGVTTTGTSETGQGGRS
jgi:RNA polymerase sigma-70 factor (ECF subfamily)